MKRLQVRISGVGGQGVITAGDVLCEAAIRSGFHSIKKPAYTSQVRGGPTLVEVLISEEEIFMISSVTDFMVCTANVSFNRFKSGVKPKGIIVIDPNLVFPTSDDRKTWKIVEIPIVEIAKVEVGSLATQSTLALAITVQLTRCVNPQAALEAMLAHIPKKVWEVNRTAFNLGIKYAGAVQIRK